VVRESQGKIFFWEKSENEMLQLVKDLLSCFVKRDSLVTCTDVTSFDTNDAAKNTTLLLTWASQQTELFEVRASRRRK